MKCFIFTNCISYDKIQNVCSLTVGMKFHLLLTEKRIK